MDVSIVYKFGIYPRFRFNIKSCYQHSHLGPISLYIPVSDTYTTKTTQHKIIMLVVYLMQNHHSISHEASDWGDG